MIAHLENRDLQIHSQKSDPLNKAWICFSDRTVDHCFWPTMDFLHRKGHGCLFLPKFHCEINPIEKCWSQAKRYTRARTNYTVMKLRTLVPDGLDSAKVENIRNYFRKTRHYMYGYLAGSSGGPQLDKLVNDFKKEYTVEPLKNGPLKSGQPLYNGHFAWNEPIFTLRLRLTE